MAAGGHTSGDAVAGVTIAFTVVSVIGTILRLYTRFILNGMGGPDDVVIAIATTLAVGLTTTMCVQVIYGTGRHQSTLTEHEVIWAGKWFWASLWVYYSALFCAKLAILLQYLRIFPQPNFRRICYSLIAMIAAYSCWTIFSAIFSCTPISYFWIQNIDPTAEGKCLNRLAVWFANASFNILTDVAIAVLPLPVIKSLNLPRRQRLALTFVFCLGGITCIVSLLRLQSLYAVSVSKDISWDNPMAALWSNLEVNIGIICSCLPTLKTSLTRIFPRIFASSSRGASSNGGIVTIGGHHTSGGYQLTTGEKRKTMLKKRDSIGMHFLSRTANDNNNKTNKTVEVYDGTIIDEEDMVGTRIRPGSSRGQEKEGDKIQVVTVVQQASTPVLPPHSPRSGGSVGDSESMRKLVD